MRRSLLLLSLLLCFVLNSQSLCYKTDKPFTADVYETTDTAFCERLFALIDSTIDVNKDPYVQVSICSITNERLHYFDGNWDHFFIVATTTDRPSYRGTITYNGIFFILPAKIPPIMKKTGKTVTMHEYGLKFFDSDNMTVIECNRGQLEYITKDYIDIYRSFYE